MINQPAATPSAPVAVGARRRPPMVLGSVLLCLVATACPSSMSTSSTTTAIEPFDLDLGADAVAVEIGVTVEPGEDLAEWLDRRISIEIDNVDNVEALIEVLDEDGDLIEAGLIADAARQTTVAVTQQCDDIDCGGDFRIRVRSLSADPAAASFGGNLSFEANSYGTDETRPVSVTTGSSESLDSTDLRSRSNLSDPATLEIDTDQRVAGQRVEVAGGDCSESPWIVSWPSDQGLGPGASQPQLRVVTAASDRAVEAGSALQLDGSCIDGETSFWVVLAAPVTRDAIAIDWVLLSGPTSEARIDGSVVGVRTSTSVDLTGDTALTLEPLELPAAGATLHLVEGVADDSAAITGGGPDGIVAEVSPAPAQRASTTGAHPAPVPWFGTRFAAVAAGPCPELACPSELSISLRNQRYVGDEPVAASATVFSLVAMP